VRPVHRLARRDLGEHLGLHHVHTGIDRVAEHLTPGGLLEEPLDPPRLVGDDDAELQRVRLAGQPDGDEGATLLVEPHHVSEIHVGERVAGDNEELIVLERVFRVLDAAGRAERHLLGGVLQRHADVFAVAEVVAHQRGEELHGDDGFLETVFLEQPQHVLHDRPVHHRQQRLGLIRGHRAQPSALTARHDYGFH